jgi:hypothetical protein
MKVKGKLASLLGIGDNPLPSLDLRDPADNEIVGTIFDTNHPTKVVTLPGEVWAVLFTNGEVDMEALEKECYKDRWCPLLGVVPKGQEGPITLVCFNNPMIGVSFLKKNMPKGWVPGLVRMPEGEVAYCKSKGWLVEVYNYPRRVMNHPDLDVVSLIHEFQDDPYVKGGGLNLPSVPKEQE